MNINPASVAAARTARLVREAATPVYSTVTPARVREHVKVVEMEDEMGRSWSLPMRESAVDAYIDGLVEVGYWVSDIDCSVKCWCAK